MHLFYLYLECNWYSATFGMDLNQRCVVKRFSLQLEHFSNAFWGILIGDNLSSFSIQTVSEGLPLCDGFWP